jgi:transcriptional regulator GlxA family with amidase domain
MAGVYGTELCHGGSVDGTICGHRVIDANTDDGQDLSVVSPAPRRIVIVAFGGVQALDVVGPFEVFAGASEAVAAGSDHTGGAYDVSAVSSGGALVTSESGLTIATGPLPDPSAPIDTLVLAGGRGVHRARHDEALVDWVRTVAPRSRRIATVCTGTFLAAEAGLLDGCTVTTHWARAERLAAEFPAITVDADPIFSRSRNVWTSAGVTAGIDLCLALVEDDHGTEIAQTVGRWLVMFLRRPGGQTQFAAPVWMPRAERSSVLHVQQAIERDPGDDHCIAVLAGRASMSPRHFTRVFTDEVGESPARYVERVRTEAARHMLEDTSDTVAVIARRSGFGTAETMRRAFVRRLGVAPDQYRRRFGSAA